MSPVKQAMKKAEAELIRRVLESTANRKMKGLPLTSPQSKLHEHLSLNGGELSFEDACRIEWRSLGGLLVRGKAQWVKTKNGTVLRATA